MLLASPLEEYLRCLQYKRKPLRAPVVTLLILALNLFIPLMLPCSNASESDKVS